VSLRQGGTAGGDGGRLANADPLVIGEEESLVAADAAAGGGPEFIAPEGRLGHTQAVVEERVGVELVVAQEFVGRTVEIVRAGFGLHHGHGSGGGSVLGR